MIFILWTNQTEDCYKPVSYIKMWRLFSFFGQCRQWFGPYANLKRKLERKTNRQQIYGAYKALMIFILCQCTLWVRSICHFKTYTFFIRNFDNLVAWNFCRKYDSSDYGPVHLLFWNLQIYYKKLWKFSWLKFLFSTAVS